MSNENGRKSEIKFAITLDEKNIPLEIKWQASDKSNVEEKACKSMMISLWDPEEKNTLRIDLWTKEMRVDEMHIHFLQTLITMAESYGRATGNPFIMDEMRTFGDSMAKKITDWEKSKEQ